MWYIFIEKYSFYCILRHGLCRSYRKAFVVRPTFSERGLPGVSTIQLPECSGSYQTKTRPCTWLPFYSQSPPNAFNNAAFWRNISALCLNLSQIYNSTSLPFWTVFLCSTFEKLFQYQTAFILNHIIVHVTSTTHSPIYEWIVNCTHYVVKKSWVNSVSMYAKGWCNNLVLSKTIFARL